MPSCARKMLVAAQAGTKKEGRAVHKGGVRGLHADASLSVTVINPLCKKMSSCLLSLGTGNNMLLFLISAKKRFELISWFFVRVVFSVFCK